MGRDQHHHPPHRPWIPRHPPAETHDTLNPLEFPNTLSGKKNLNTIKTTIISDGAGRTLWTGAHRPGRQHDQTAFDTEGIDDLLDHFPHARALVDAGYRGLRKRHRGQIVAPPPSTRSRNTVSVVTADIRDRARQRHSSQRIAVEHAIAAHKQ
ncbi:transposase family protein [Pseudonocardia sp. ICBG601]|uniref:transposase family protein n=1 Tax=Pseudonocardia sp. ICBG601 TaxID=2846759 RepID=UPI0035AC290F